MQVPPPIPEPFSWLREVLVPTLFTLLGAILGFLAGEMRDDWRAKKASVSFVRAIGLELDALSDQLDASFHEVRGSIERLRTGGTGPQFAAGLRTIVFTSQLEKLRDVNDPLMLKIVHFYSDLGTLEQIWVLVNEMAIEYNRADSKQKQDASNRLLSGLISLQQQISGFGSRLKVLRREIAAWLVLPSQTTNLIALFSQKIDEIANH